MQLCLSAEPEVQPPVKQKKQSGGGQAKLAEAITEKRTSN